MPCLAHEHAPRRPRQLARAVRRYDDGGIGVNTSVASRTSHTVNEIMSPCTGFLTRRATTSAGTGAGAGAGTGTGAGTGRSTCSVLAPRNFVQLCSPALPREAPKASAPRAAVIDQAHHDALKPGAPCSRGQPGHVLHRYDSRSGLQHALRLHGVDKLWRPRASK